MAARKETQSGRPGTPANGPAPAPGSQAPPACPVASGRTTDTATGIALNVLENLLAGQESIRVAGSACNLLNVTARHAELACLYGQKTTNGGYVLPLESSGQVVNETTEPSRKE